MNPVLMIILSAVIMLVLLFFFSACKLASECDRHAEEMLHQIMMGRDADAVQKEVDA